jgi:hypothetical protein
MQQEFEQAEVAQNKALSIILLAKQMELREAELGWGENKRGLTVFYRLGLLCLRSSQGVLSRADREAFNSEVLAVKPFLSLDKSIPFTKRRAVKQATQRIIELGQSLT